jgi:hypothetical protein
VSDVFCGSFGMRGNAEPPCGAKVPRKFGAEGIACAGLVAREAGFFSFGTNDLTQTTMGLPRDDFTKFPAILPIQQRPQSDCLCMRE